MKNFALAYAIMALAVATSLPDAGLMKSKGASAAQSVILTVAWPYAFVRAVEYDWERLK